MVDHDRQAQIAEHQSDCRLRRNVGRGELDGHLRADADIRYRFCIEADRDAQLRLEILGNFRHGRPLYFKSTVFPSALRTAASAACPPTATLE